MKINRDNYEAYFLDYHEGQLSPEMAAEVLMFVDQHPDLKDAFEEFEAVTLLGDPNIVFEKKSSLKKNQVIATSQVNELNIEEFLISETEGILNAEQKSGIDEFIRLNPQFDNDRKLYALAHLPIDEDVIFEAKQSLKQKAIPVGQINAATYETYMARELEGDLHTDEELQLAEFMRFNPYLEQERKLYQHTILSAEKDVVFENKDDLKQKVIPLRRIVYFALSAAAVLALIFSIYFLLDRNDIPVKLAQQGNTKNKVHSTTSDPVPALTDKQADAKTLPGKDTKPISDRKKVDDVTTVSANPDKNHTGAVFAYANRQNIESVQSQSAITITTRSYVDPQFTFIRTSQMYMNQNLELYYNLKLAEQIEYAQLNQGDKDPARTILNAITAKARGLLASNNATHPQEEKKNISLWTFAELGVKTFNTITSSELELKLQKDDEGKVVSYGIESGLIDFEKEVKK